MRREWRNVLALGLSFLTGTTVTLAQTEVAKDLLGANREPIRLTVEVAWAVSARGGDGNNGIEAAESGELGCECLLELTSGRVIEVIPWPPDGLAGATGQKWLGAAKGQGPGPDGSWRLGRLGEGRVRARLETTPDGSLVVRAGDQAVSLPLTAVLEKPQRTPPQAPLVVSVERLGWDSLVVDLGEQAGDGIVAPGANVPVSIGWNIVTPETTDVAVRTSAVLRPIRGGEVHWRDEQQDLVSSNQLRPAARLWNIPTPRSEGTYVLEIRATWESAVREGSRIGRLIRRRKSAAVSGSAVRRVTVTVIDPQAGQASAAAPTRTAHPRGIEVDSLDLSRLRTRRLLASGRSPTAEAGKAAWAVPPAALIEPSRRDWLRGWLMRSGAEAARLDAADSTGLAWSAVGLKVSHPDRPHRLSIKVTGGEPASLGVALVETGTGAGGGASSRLVLDACASGPPILQDGPPAAFTWLVWPNSSEMVLVLVNRGIDAPVRLGTVTLAELDDLPAPPNIVAPHTKATRTLGLYLSGPGALDRFGGASGLHDALVPASNLARYLGHCGATAVVLPEDLADRSLRRALEGLADEDSTGPDRLQVARTVLARQGYATWLELRFDKRGALPGLPPADSAQAVERGLVRIDRAGLPDGPAYHPIHPEVRAAMRDRVVQCLTSYTRPSEASTKSPWAGLVIRLGPGPTLLGTPDTGLDDATFERFVREKFAPETARGIPGTGSDDPNRFAVRSDYLKGVGRMPWLTWRSHAIATLYTELARAARTAAPGTFLAVVTPSLDSGPAGTEARRVDRAGLVPSDAWRSVGLDLSNWPDGADSPAVLRGISLSDDALAHDLATNFDLDKLVAARGQNGLFLNIDGDLSGDPSLGSASRGRDPAGVALASDSSFAPLPDDPALARGGGEAALHAAAGARQTVWLTALALGDGPTAEEPLGHALAALDARFVFLAEKAVAGHEERIGRFASVFRALPNWPATNAGERRDPSSRQFGVTVHSMSDESQTFLEIANDSPYPIRIGGVLEAPDAAAVDDVGRGLRLLPVKELGTRRLVLDLFPFGAAAVRVAAHGARLTSVVPYPSPAVVSTMQAQFDDLSAQLVRLNRGLASVPNEPLNPGFEPDPPLPVSSPAGAEAIARNSASPGSEPPIPRGWHRLGESTSTTLSIDRNNPHSGQGSLRLSATQTPASAASEPFVPNVQASLTVEAYFRASHPGARVRVWIEGESSGRSYVRRTELEVSTAWEPRAMRASDLPAGGLESARLRFELVAPGALWVDDLRVVNEVAFKSLRLNTQHTLLAALQAYREERYADFARLAGSHWIRQANASAVSRLARNNDRLSPSGSSRSLPGEAASPLPSDRKLR
jgi:hypothetical protein